MKIFRPILTSLIGASGRATSNLLETARKLREGLLATLTDHVGGRLSTVAMEEVKKIWRETDAVCLDVDSTVVREEAIDELARFVGKGEEVAKLTREAMKGGDYREMLKLRLNLISPTEQQLQEYIQKHPHTFTPGVEELIMTLKKRNIPIYLVSGGLRQIIYPVAKKLNIPEENVFANKLLFKDGKYIGFDTNEPTSKQLGKAEVMFTLKKKFGYKKLVMIGDGSIDAEAHPPADAFIGFGGNIVRENVREKAKWFVMSFKELTDELNKTSA